MESRREFYPMITSTVKTLIRIVDPDDDGLFLTILKAYPDIKGIKREFITPTLDALIDELDRQYARWQRGNK